MRNQEELVEVISRWWDKAYLTKPQAVRAGSYEMSEEIKALAGILLYEGRRIPIASEVEELLRVIEESQFEGVEVVIDRGSIAWDDDYAVFSVTSINSGIYSFEHGETDTFDEGEFWFSFEKHFRDAFKDDPKVQIVHRYGLHEFEFYRESQGEVGSGRLEVSNGEEACQHQTHFH